MLSTHRGSNFLVLLHLWFA
uniref:Uncharacterized protein n=1 Tax=Arundo donax TaxID=35708 RepID=A0A0A9ATH7_ARUDO